MATPPLNETEVERTKRPTCASQVPGGAREQTVTADAPMPTENPKDALGKSKPCISFIPSIAILMEGVVMALGGRKYGPFNWRETSVQASVYSDAAFRHLAAWNDGEENDPESGVSHLAHVRANMGILMDAQEHGTMKDDRAKSGKVIEFLKAFGNKG